MMNFGALKWFGSFIKKLIKSIGLYQACDVHLCGGNSIFVAHIQSSGSESMPMAAIVSHSTM